ncbi:MAG: hypothetical protein LBS99_07940 [Clostridiales bacterium]|jgi:exopolyphosphatase/guanosine-5'-triphosphate,3'-diphosphate pyrophosphatase|nr:hypothetical protein [Clostridiales bacterium]
MKSIAVIDIGSNSVRLGYPQPGKPTLKQLNTTQLAEGLNASGRLSPLAIDRTARAVADFCRAAEKDGAEIHIFATEAVRAAANREDFLRKTYELSGYTVEVLSPEKEALCGFIGAAGGAESATVIDIGGASVEITCGRGDKTEYIKSLPAGVVRLKESCPDRRSLDKKIDGVISEFGALPAYPVTAIGGTASSALVVERGLKVFDPLTVHNSVLTLGELEQTAELLFALTPLRITALYPLIAPRRAEVLAAGVLLLSRLLRHTGRTELVVSELDNIEGYLLMKQKV